MLGLAQLAVYQLHMNRVYDSSEASAHGAVAGITVLTSCWTFVRFAMLSGSTRPFSFSHLMDLESHSGGRLLAILLVSSIDAEPFDLCGVVDCLLGTTVRLSSAQLFEHLQPMYRLQCYSTVFLRQGNDMCKPRQETGRE
jgi:hypothetical protein